MAQSHTEPNYMGVFYSLAVLTVLEIGATFLPIPRLLIGILLVGLAATKAALVALYFMHLKFERRTLMWIALTPAVICTFLVLMLLPDSTDATRRFTQTTEQTAPQGEPSPSAPQTAPPAQPPATPQ